MNQLERYRLNYRAATGAIVRRPTVDLSVLDGITHEANVPIEALTTVDTSDRVLNERLRTESMRRLLGYFAVNEDRQDVVFDFLSPRDQAPSSGVLFVYGAGGNARPRQAAELYAAAPQPVIISDADSAVLDRFTQILTDRGVAERDIVREDRGRNFLENAWYCSQLLAERGDEHKPVTIVTESLVARRALVATQSFAPEPTLVRSFPMLTDPENPEGDATSPNNWYASELGMTLLLNEILGFELYRRMGLIDTL